MSVPVERPSWSSVRARLEALGFRPAKALGQNFLRDPNLARAMVDDAGIAPGDRVLEVGPGCGFLTLELVARGVELLAVEIDARLHRLVGELLGPQASVRLLCCDVLAGKHRLAPEVEAALWNGPEWHVVANLPYNSGTPFLALVARREHPPSSITVLLQRELALRLAAGPGSRAWGALGARLGLVYGARIVRSVAPELFWPRPKVDSAVVRLDLRPDRPSPVRIARYDALVETLFHARRKTIQSRLAAWLGSSERSLELLAAAGLDPSARAETLEVAQFLALADATLAAGVGAERPLS